jgi:FkbM family methyltransferase
MKALAESLRYDYPLDAESFVLDCGAYEGNFSRWIVHKYGCRVFAFEPCRKHFEVAQATLREFGDRVTLLNVGIGGETRNQALGVQGDSTGFFNVATEMQMTTIMALAPLLSIIGAPEKIDLIKLNVEGSEYEILEHAITSGIVSRFAHIQIQWHANVKDHENLRRRIVGELLKTHDFTWGDPSFHESYNLKTT